MNWSDIESNLLPGYLRDGLAVNVSSRTLPYTYATSPALMRLPLPQIRLLHAVMPSARLLLVAHNPVHQAYAQFHGSCREGLY